MGKLVLKLAFCILQPEPYEKQQGSDGLQRTYWRYRFAVEGLLVGNRGFHG